MKGYEVDVGGDDFESLGGGALQGGINTGAVNTAAVAEDSHNLLAFGTSLGTVEFWDSRSRSRVGLLPPPTSLLDYGSDAKAEITALEFHRSGLNLAAGSSSGLVYTYDLRSPTPLLKKDQGYGYPIQTLKYLSSSRNLSSEKILSADKRIIKIWDAESGDPWTSVEPAVDLNHVEVVPDSGMLLTANEGMQQHSFFIPQLGPAPKWCAFLDNLVEEMAEDAADPNAFTANGLAGSGEVYDNYKFLDNKQLRELNLDHLVGTTSLLRPYMHGHFVAQKLYEQARLISNPEVFEQQRSKSIQEKIDRERESRIRGSKKVSVKVNRRLAERMAARDEANERRKAKRVLAQGGDEPAAAKIAPEDEAEDAPEKPARGVLGDDRFTKLFQDEDFEIDETSREFALLNPSSVPNAGAHVRMRGLTAAEEEERAARRGSESSASDEDDDDADEQDDAAALRARQRPQRQNMSGDTQRIGSSSYKKAGHASQRPRQQPQMQVSSSQRKTQQQRKQTRDKSFGDLASSLPSRQRQEQGARGSAVGEKEVTFAPAKVQKRRPAAEEDNGRNVGRGKERRSASGNVFRKM